MATVRSISNWMGVKATLSLASMAATMACRSGRISSHSRLIAAAASPMLSAPISGTGTKSPIETRFGLGRNTLGKRWRKKTLAVIDLTYEY
ncbi:hypothetical protein BC828DRAFT_117715 [Blastocladiella britannica]|nr:hypothetical protein BC828DRAFT_117715 [Blastocladiella britannica]